MIKSAFKRSERGQAIVLMVIVLAALLGIVGLAVDGGRLYYGQRTAQNAADNAALAGALALCDGSSVTTKGFAIAAVNDFNNDGVTNTVTVNNPPTSGPNAGDLEHVEVIITSVQQAAFAQLLFSGDLESTVRSVASCDLRLAFEYAIFGGSETCNNTIDWSGSDIVVKGGVHTNNDLKLSGSTNLVEGNVTYVDSVNDSGGSNVYVPPPPDNPLPGQVEPFPISYDMADYVPGGSAALAAAADGGRYYSCNCKMDMGWLKGQGLFDESTKILQDGLYYTSDEISLSDSDIIGNAVTFVSRDAMTFSGASHTLSPYIDGLLAFTDLNLSGNSACEVAAMQFSGSSHSWRGVIFAPNGLVKMSGSDSSTVSGSVFALAVKLSGSVISIQSDQSLLPAPPPELNLEE